MEAKDSLVKVIKALVDIAAPTRRQMLVDYLVGKESREITENKLDELETYASGDNHDEDYWTMLVEKAYDAGYLKAKPAKSDTLVASLIGKRFAKSPTSFIIDEDEEDSENMTNDCGLEELVNIAVGERVTTTTRTSERTKQHIKLIQAIDRKIALDDFAESEGMDLNDVLDDLESLLHQGLNLDITYFTDEVLGEECVNELVDYFKSVKDDNINKALKEYGDVYKSEEIRLARIVYRKMKYNGNSKV